MIGIKVEHKEAIIRLQKIHSRMGDMRPFFINFYHYMTSVTLSTFRRLKKGGQYRGVKWEWFAPQYRRADGTIVPAEGGIAKVKGEGVVKGRLRPSGARVDSSSNLLQDTGGLRSSALNWMHKSKQIMIMDTKLEYAGYQNQIRPFAFFEIPKDEKVARDLFIKYVGS